MLGTGRQPRGHQPGPWLRSATGHRAGQGDPHAPTCAHVGRQSTGATTLAQNTRPRLLLSSTQASVRGVSAAPQPGPRRGRVQLPAPVTVSVCHHHPFLSRETSLVLPSPCLGPKGPAQELPVHAGPRGVSVPPRDRSSTLGAPLPRAPSMGHDRLPWRRSSPR